jgi:hypothetical protein
LDAATRPSRHTSSKELEDDDELDEPDSTQSMDTNDHTSGGAQPTLTRSHSPLDAATCPCGHTAMSKELDDDAPEASAATQSMDE